jgi:hypothetical protein
MSFSPQSVYYWPMFRPTHTNRRRTAKSLLALLAGLWLLAAAAPCVMAATHCPHGMNGDCDSMDTHPQPAANPCDSLQAVDCERNTTDSLAANIPVVDISVLPVLLTTLPHNVVEGPARGRDSAPDRYAFLLYPPPHRLQHSVLLI